MLRLILLFSSFIPIKESFIYLGITIYKNIHKIARDNFNNILVKVKNDIQRWKNLKVSLQGRISTVKRNLLPRFNFFFSMLPLSPPPGYFKEINSIISKFIWNDKCPRIKLTTSQHPNSVGGLAVPNFELYYWSFQLKALRNWVDPQSTVSWRVIEADKVKPNRLQDILFTGTGKKGDNYKFGPVVANSIKIWKTVERRIGGPFKFCNSTPLWHNFNFVWGNRPFVQPSLSSLGVNTSGDIYSPFHTARWSRKIARKLPECLLCERKHVPGLIPGLIPGWGPSNIAGFSPGTSAV